MIAFSLLLAGLTLVVLPGLVGQPRRLRGRDWACAVALSLATGSVAVVFGLVVLALPTLLAALHSAGLGELCAGVPVPLSPGGPMVGWAALFVALVVSLRGLRSGRRALREAMSAEVEPWLGRHEDCGDFELVVLPTDALMAMSVPAATPQVVISEGLVERLEPQQLDVVVRHEITHHRFGHWRYSLLATAVECGLRPLPFVAGSTRTLRDSLENWADEAAAGSSSARRAQVRRALVAVGSASHGADAPQAQLRNRVGRLACRSGPASGLGAVAVAPALLLGPTALLTVVVWNVFAHHVASLAGYCGH